MGARTMPVPRRPTANAAAAAAPFTVGAASLLLLLLLGAASSSALVVAAFLPPSLPRTTKGPHAALHVPSPIRGSTSPSFPPPPSASAPSALSSGPDPSIIEDELPPPLPSTTTTTTNPHHPWYSDPTLLRSRSGLDAEGLADDSTDVEHAASSHAARFVLFHGRRGAYHLETTTTLVDDTLDDTNDDGEDDEGAAATASVQPAKVVKVKVEPLYLRYAELEDVLGAAVLGELVSGRVGMNPDTEDGLVLVWVGEDNSRSGGGMEYWAVGVPHDDDDDGSGGDTWEGRLERVLVRRKDAPPPTTTEPTTIPSSSSSSSVKLKPVREFGDILSSQTDSAILATSNGLLNFHSTSRFCSKCGSSTRPIRAGTGRRCTGASCGVGVYPRIEPAVIVLVTSPCDAYALLGRKKSWPKGRYSTLAGFVELGETLESCVVREVWEESGIKVDLDTVEFVCSQPWPFPKSLMVGFRATAVVAADPSAVGDVDGDDGGLPKPVVEINELEDVKWFDKGYVAAKMKAEGVHGGSTALTYVPQTEDEEEFHVPGRSSLARMLIGDWAMGESGEW